MGLFLSPVNQVSPTSMSKRAAASSSSSGFKKKQKTEATSKASSSGNSLNSWLSLPAPSIPSLICHSQELNDRDSTFIAHGALPLLIMTFGDLSHAFALPPSPSSSSSFPSSPWSRGLQLLQSLRKLKPKRSGIISEKPIHPTLHRMSAWHGE